MSADNKKDEGMQITLPYQEMMERSLLICGGPTRCYVATKPREVFETYRDLIEQHIRKKYPSMSVNFVVELSVGCYYNNDYGGRYTFSCYLPDAGEMTVTIVEPFEASDGELANDSTERKRRAQISVT